MDLVIIYPISAIKIWHLLGAKYISFSHTQTILTLFPKGIKPKFHPVPATSSKFRTNWVTTHLFIKDQRWLPMIQFRWYKKTNHMFLFSWWYKRIEWTQGRYNENSLLEKIMGDTQWPLAYSKMNLWQADIISSMPWGEGKVQMTSSSKSLGFCLLFSVANDFALQKLLFQPLFHMPLPEMGICEYVPFEWFTVFTAHFLIL